MVTKQIEITHWPDTFEGFVKEYGTGMSPRMLEDYLIFQAVEHYFPIKQCDTCKYYNDSFVTTRNYGYCYLEHVEDDPSGHVSPNFGCVDWRARE